jgi:hypothetical protein
MDWEHMSWLRPCYMWTMLPSSCVLSLSLLLALQRPILGSEMELRKLLGGNSLYITAIFLVPESRLEGAG